LIPTTGGQAPFFVSPARHGEAQNMSGTWKERIISNCPLNKSNKHEMQVIN
jgi:hypothetical protein